MILLLAVTLSAVDYATQVAPLLHAKCAACHRPGEVAPFPLLTYQDAKSHIAEIAKVVDRNIMPPWKAVEGDFAGSRALTANEKKLILDWAKAGAPRGNPAKEPPPPVFKAGEWQLGEPDVVLEMPVAFDVPAGGNDLYQCFVIPLAVAGYVKAWEFQPGSRDTVHHALFFTDGSKTARKRASATGTYSCFGVPGFLPSGSLGGWSPGFAPFQSPTGTASRLQPGHDLVMQIHYHPSGRPEQDRSRIGLYLTKDPPPKRIVDIALVSKAIDIAPGDAAYKVTDYFTIPIDVDVVGIIPHAHYICKRMTGWATLPNGKKQTLIRIDDWDFNWQEQYYYRRPIRLPAGTKVEMEFVYDNSAANPRNPSNPPKRVEWGPDATDEMAGLHIQAIPVRMEELPELGRALWGKIMRALGGFIPSTR
ncbi:MAG: ascorbate-dependent monooxygenase [Acidobacteria bacterium]|nr:ascorbate-dependent monooxygenase [Acidobacteriota bacterium]